MERWLPVTVMGAAVLVGYLLNRQAIRGRATDLSDLLVTWAVAAAIGFLATAWAIAEFVAGSPSDAEAVGLYVFLAGQIVWAAVVGRNAEAPAMALSHAGIVLWAAAAADRGETRAIAATMAAAAYHILIDLSWYAHAVINRDSTIWTHAERLFAAHSGTLAMTHYLFAAYVALRSEDDAWAPEVRLNFNRWVRNGTASCAEEACVVYATYTTWGTMPASHIVATFSWVSGTNHIVTYLGAFADSETVHRWVFGPTGAGPNVLRSADWAVSAALMMAINLALYSMPTDAVALVLTTVLTAFVMLAGYAVDILVAADKIDDACRIFGVAAALYAISWTPLFVIFHEILNNSETIGGLNTAKPPDEVIAYIAYLFLTFMSFPLAAAWKLSRPPTSKNNVKAETVFAWLSLLSKLPLLMIFSGGVSARRNTVRPGEEPEEPKEFVWQALVVGLGTVTVIAAWMRWFPHRRPPAAVDTARLL